MKLCFTRGKIIFKILKKIYVLAKHIFLCSKSPIAPSRMWHKYHTMNMKHVMEWESRNAHQTWILVFVIIVALCACVIFIEWWFLRCDCTEIIVNHSGMWMFCLCVKLASWMMWTQYPTGGGAPLQSGPQVVRMTFLWPSLSVKLPIPALQASSQTARSR